MSFEKFVKSIGCAVVSMFILLIPVICTLSWVKGWNNGIRVFSSSLTGALYGNVLIVLNRHLNTEK